MSDQPTAADFARAVRELNAACNSFRRAQDELARILGEDQVVLHHLPTEQFGDETLCWSYGVTKDRDGNVILHGVRRPKEERRNRFHVIAAPGPVEEFLPRLESQP